eukprot:TRINITY_DN7082_c0_g1_i2.p1 TRINITY_DN7082_c0_g1~~TRINITY_DN7082_c0_g1_i2.p1  ORF type:complete len:1036 (+),score=475.65 TRINITY_DN7082_c0_g1_i2:122-3229(+)
MPIKTSILNSLQANTSNIRNICILAHVDHGKTTLSDSLICSNGIISNKSAGKVRYLDNLPDEIERMITMKSSCISLLYQEKSILEKPADQVTPQEAKDKSYLINLIDSPGHVDFSSEVSTAVRVCDGALIIVDAVEGVCIQTHTVLKQAWNEKVRPCLVINKLDRLINELKLTPLEAYDHLKRILSQVNDIVATLFSVEWFKDLESKASQLESEEVIDYEESEEEKGYFSPEKGNVVFASAFDGWAFRVDDFCEMYGKKLGVKASTLQKTLWGDFFFNPKTKKIHQKNPTGKLIPMFVMFALNNIWEVYQAANENDLAKREKIVKALKLEIPQRELNNTDAGAVVNAICSRWLPISHGVLGMVIQMIPNPIEAQSTRIQKLWQSSVSSESDSLSEKQSKLEVSMRSCDKNAEDVVVFVSKVFAADNSSFLRSSNQRSTRNDTTIITSDSSNEDKLSKGIGAIRMQYNSNDKFVGFSRIFCGTIRVGQKIQVLGPRYNPLEPEKHRTEMEVKELFLLMGRNLESVESIPAGNVFGIGGIEENIIKTATLSSTEFCPVFNAMTSGSSPIVRVAVEAENPLEMSQLVEGLKILNASDPSVQVLIQETGERVIVASGELHLERCLKDLKESFARVEFRVSPPIVAFRETVTNDPSLRIKPNQIGVKTPNKMVNIKISAIPIPENIRVFLEKNNDIIRKIFVEESSKLVGDTDAASFRENITKEFEAAGSNWAKELDYIWAFGPRRVGSNILLNHIPNYSQNAEVWKPITYKMSSDYNPKNRKNKLKQNEDENKEENNESQIISSEESNVKEVIEPVSEEERLELLKQIENSVFVGFQAATAFGPLCEEPMSGVCFVVEDISFLKSNQMEKYSHHGPLGGQIISAVKQACRQSFLEKSCRLLEPVYTCDVQVTSDAMGKVYGVLGRRRAKILNEVMKENSLVIIEALLPAVESFGLSEELLKSTSGAASTQLLFNGFEVLDQDPFFVATTEEELEDIGSNLGGEAPNIAKLYINNIRRRKGPVHVNKQSIATPLTGFDAM